MDSDRYCDYSKELVLLEMKRRSICEKNGLVGYTGCTESYMKYADK